MAPKLGWPDAAHGTKTANTERGTLKGTDRDGDKLTKRGIQRQDSSKKKKSSKWNSKPWECDKVEVPGPWSKHETFTLI
jgi:hypothetical protein